MDLIEGIKTSSSLQHILLNPVGLWEMDLIEGIKTQNNVVQ